MRRQRLAGVAFALLGLVLATASAMNLARNAEAGHPWIPPWLVAVLGGAGLVAGSAPYAAMYLVVVLVFLTYWAHRAAIDARVDSGRFRAPERPAP